jgi:hypothetical protein
MSIGVKTRPIPLKFVARRKRRHIEKQLIVIYNNISCITYHVIISLCTDVTLDEARERTSVSWMKIPCSGQEDFPQGPVVQRWVSANPGLKFNLLFWLVYFCTSVYFKTSEK